VVVERLFSADALGVRPADDDSDHRPIFFMIRGMMGGQRSNDRLPLDILKERLARGEISQAEYEERRRLIEA
jgi:hypothetical protein